MSWLLLDDRILAHPKFVRAERLGGSAAFHLWVGLLSFCKQRLTDGVVPLDMVDKVDGPAPRWRARALDALVGAGLVQRDEVAVRLHDYLAHNDSRAHVERKLSEKRARDEARKAAYLNRAALDTNTNTPTVTATLTKREGASKKASRVKTPARARWRCVADAHPDWQPNELHAKLALKYAKDLRVEAAKFRDYEFAVHKTDPDRTFNNWLRRTKGDL